MPRASKLSFKFLELKELPRVIEGICLLFEIKGTLRSDFKLLSIRIYKLWRNSGKIFTIKYLSEVLRLIFVFISGEDTRDHAV
jgi:hypothetical protein